MIVTYKDVLGNMWSTGEISSFSSWFIGEFVLILPMKGSCLLHREISSQLAKGLPSCLKLTRESFNDILLYWGFG